MQCTHKYIQDVGFGISCLRCYPHLILLMNIQWLNLHNGYFLEGVEIAWKKMLRLQGLFESTASALDSA